MLAEGARSQSASFAREYAVRIPVLAIARVVAIRANV
jgi:hypothetical protein